MRFVAVASTLVVLLAIGPAAVAQKPPPEQSKDPAPPAAVSKQDVDTEAQLQKAISDAGNNRAALDAVIAALLEKETISGDELTEIVDRSRSETNGREPVAAAASPEPSPSPDT